MDIRADYHMHTRASDGEGTALDKARRAVELGLSEIAICDHGCGSFLFHQTEKKFEAQRRDIARANAECGVRVLSGIEASITGEDGRLDVPDSVIRACDVLTVGFHRFLQPRYIFASPRFLLVNGWGSAGARGREDLVALNTRAWLAALERYPVDVLCHIGHRAQVDVGAVCRAAAERGVYIELNEKHIDALEASAREVLASGAEFILGSDAHATAKVGLFPKAEAFVNRHGIAPSRICGVGATPHFHPKKDFKSID